MAGSKFSHACSAVLAVFLLASISTLAQTTGGRLLGRISDPTGAVLNGTKVTLTNEATGVTQTAESNKSGDYQFVEVPVGRYSLQFDHPGFKKVVKKGIVVEINQVVTMNMPMQLGQTQEVVEVTSEAPLVDTTSTQLGAVVNDRAVTQLPLNARDTYQFLQLQPGVQSQLGGNSDLFYGSDKAGTVSVNGGRGRSNNFSVNGGDANDMFVNLPTVQPSPDSIQEFRVITNTFDAEYGRNSGAVVNVVTKSGTNNFHGDVYEFFRHDKLNARGYFDTVKPEFRQNQFGGTFGGPIKKDRTFFFTSYEGRRITQGKSSDTVAVPTQAERTGNFSADGAFGGQITNQFVADVLNGRPGCTNAIMAQPGAVTPAAGVAWSSIFPTSVIPAPCQDPVAADLLKFVPGANTSTGLFQTVVNGTDRQDQFTIRLDHRINDKQNFSAYYYFTDDTLFQPFSFFQAAGANVPGFGGNYGSRWQQINLDHTWTLNSTTVNDLRFTYMREGQRTFNHAQHTAPVTSSCGSSVSQFCFTGVSDSATINALGLSKLGITPNLGAAHEGLPDISVSGGFTIGNNFEGELPQVGNSFQWTDNITKVHGNHTLKFGADVRRQRFDQTLFFEVNGFYQYTGIGANDVFSSNQYPDYLLGLPDSYQQGSAQTENVRATGLYLFGQDSWKIKPNLTLNYGLRWELDTPIADVSHRVQTFRPGQTSQIYPCQLSGPSIAAFTALGVANPNCANTGVTPVGLVVPGDKGVPPGLTQTYYKAFAPRIGLAWSPNASTGLLGKLFGGEGKTSIRTGFGIFYNPIEQLVLEQFSAEPPFGGSTFLANTFFNTPFMAQAEFQNPNPFNGILNPTPGQPVDWSVFRPILLFGEFQPHMRTQYSEQYNLSIQRELPHNMVMQIGYVGSQGHRLLVTHELNPSNAQTCLDIINLANANPNNVQSFGANASCGPGLGDNQYTVNVPAGFNFHMPNGTVFTPTTPTTLNFVGIRPFSSPSCNPFTSAGCPQDQVPVFSNIYAQDTIANSNYNSLQASLEKRFSNGLQFEAAYTYSKSIDQASSFEDILNPLNFGATRAASLFDARHRIVLSYYWDLPLPKYTGAKSKLLNGWALSGILTIQSGFPIRISSIDDQELNSSVSGFIAAGEPNVLAAFHTRDPHSSGCAIGTGGNTGSPCQVVNNQYFDPNIFALSALGTYGNASRTICCGPGINNWDFALHKTVPLTESKRLEFRAEMFNLLNHTGFFNPDGSITDGADFGRIKRARDPRLVQLAAKFYF